MDDTMAQYSEYNTYTAFNIFTMTNTQDGVYNPVI